MTFKTLIGGVVPPFLYLKKLTYELHTGQRSLLDYIQNLWS